MHSYQACHSNPSMVAEGFYGGRLFDSTIQDDRVTLVFSLLGICIVRLCTVYV